MIVKECLETTDPEDNKMPNLDAQLMKVPEPSLVFIKGDSTKVLRGMTATMVLIKPIVYIDISNALDISYQYSILFERGYNMYWYSCPGYNENNYKGNRFDITKDSFYIAILAVHNTVEIPDGGLDLPRIDGPTDTWMKAYDRTREST